LAVGNKHLLPTNQRSKNTWKNIKLWFPESLFCNGSFGLPLFLLWKYVHLQLHPQKKGSGFSV
jgi:hypothetical protein